MLQKILVSIIILLLAPWITQAQELFLPISQEAASQLVTESLSVLPLSEELSLPAKPDKSIIEGESSSGSAIALLDDFVMKNPPSLKRKSDLGVGLLIAGTIMTAGGFSLALMPTFSDWGPEEEDGDYFGCGFGIALGQCLLGHLPIAFGLSELIVAPVDMRAEYGAVLDQQDPAARETRAALTLKKLAQREKRYKAVTVIASFGLAATSITAYYLYIKDIGANPNVKDVGTGYVTGISLVAVLSLLALIKTEPERIYKRYQINKKK